MPKLESFYPNRTCDDCQHVYKTRRTFSNHKARGLCEAFQEENNKTGFILDWTKPDITDEVREDILQLMNTKAAPDVDNETETIKYKHHLLEQVPKVFSLIYFNEKMPRNQVIELRNQHRPYGLIRVVRNGQTCYKLLHALVTTIIPVLCNIWNGYLVEFFPGCKEAALRLDFIDTQKAVIINALHDVICQKGYVEAVTQNKVDLAPENKMAEKRKHDGPRTGQEMRDRKAKQAAEAQTEPPSQTK